MTPVDVNDDGSVSPLDALLIINELNLRGSRELPAPLVAPQLPPNYVDVSGDGVVSPLDVLQVINDLNANGARSLTVPPAAEGEGAPVFANSIHWGSADATLPTNRAADSGQRQNAPVANDLPEPESPWNSNSLYERSAMMPSVGLIDPEEEGSDCWRELEAFLNILAEDVWAVRVSTR